MITKTQVHHYKENDIDSLYCCLENSTSPTEQRFILENLGKLPSDFRGETLLPYLQAENEATRYWAVKNLGKLEDAAYLKYSQDAAIDDESSSVRREAVSAIGRMRSEGTIPVLVRFLSDPDPKVILQAARALLIFKDKERVRQCLLRLRAHPNEQIQMVLKAEFEDNPEITDYGRHPEYPDYLKNCVVNGDTREIMKLLPNGCIHLTFTSPPYYNARDYSIYKSYKQYLSFLEEVFYEVHRITKEGRFLIVNTSPVIVPRFSRKYSSTRYPIPFDLHAIISEIGWEFIDDIIWAKPEATVKNRNGGFQQHRKPLGYKPNTTTEYVMVYRKQSTKLIDWNMKQYPASIVDESKVNGDFETTNLWRIEPKSDKVHSAVFPQELCDRIIKLYSYVGDLVFDPFAGSGTFGQSAKKLKRNFFLTEQEPVYVERMKETILPGLFDTEDFARFVTMDEFRQLIPKD